MNIEHISVSRYQVFKECPVKYKYRYHLAIKPDKPEPFYFTYGKIIHKIAEEYVSKRGERVIGDIARDVLRGKIEIEPGRKAPDVPNDYARRMTGHLRAIQDLTSKIGTNGELEYKFHYDLDPPNGKYITGFIDRFIQNGDKAFIIDYKTTKKGNFRKTRSNIMHDLQLRAYAKVIQKDFNLKAENIKAALYYLEGADLIATSFTQQSIDTAEAELLKAYNEIAAADSEKVWGRVGNHCDRCDYNNICPFYNIQI